MTEADICNMGLLRTGCSETINTLDDKTKPGRVAKAFYAPLRDFALRDFDWNFARARAVLALLEVVAPTNWTYAYALPADCLRVRGLVVAGARCPKQVERAPYEIAGKVLFTDLPDAELIYTARVEDPNLFDPMFISSLAWLLVPEFSLGLVIKGDMAQQARAAYRQVASEAMAADLSEGYDTEPESDFLTVR